MNKAAQIALVLAPLLLPAVARAQEDQVYSVQASQSQKRLHLEVFQETAVFKRGSDTLFGMGLGLGVRYALSERMGLGVTMSQALAADSGLSALYTNLRGAVVYALAGTLLSEEKRITVNGQDLWSSRTAPELLWTVEGSLDQFLFNGSESVVPGSGFHGGAGVEWPAWGMLWQLRLRAGLIVLNRTPALSLQSNLGASFTF